MTAEIISFTRARIQDEAWTAAVLIFDNAVGPTAWQLPDENAGFARLWNTGFPDQKRSLADSLLKIRAEAEACQAESAERVDPAALIALTLLLHDSVNHLPLMTDDERSLLERWMKWCKEAMAARHSKSSLG